jgi:hypothetical protein
MKKDQSDPPLLGKYCVLISPEELAEKCSKNNSKKQLYEIKAQETLHRNPIFLEFLINRA